VSNLVFVVRNLRALVDPASQDFNLSSLKGLTFFGRRHLQIAGLQDSLNQSTFGTVPCDQQGTAVSAFHHVSDRIKSQATAGFSLIMAHRAFRAEDWADIFDIVHRRIGRSRWCLDRRLFFRAETQI
jgi:hypothetical protein